MPSLPTPSGRVSRDGSQRIAPLSPLHRSRLIRARLLLETIAGLGRLEAAPLSCMGREGERPKGQPSFWGSPKNKKQRARIQNPTYALGRGRLGFPNTNPGKGVLDKSVQFTTTVEP